MKGQLSFEYLMLFLVSLCLLSISVFALLNIKVYSEKASDTIVFRSSVILLSNTINEVCALGDGNSRAVFLHHNLSIESENEEIIFTASNYSLTKPIVCNVDSARLSGLVYVENNKGSIVVRQH